MTICDELTVADCTDSSGESAPGEFCDNHDCGTAACIGAAGECSKPHATPGCLVDSCCNVVCGHDPFCCNMGWDAHCVTLAAEHCPPPPPINDRCADFLEVTVGQTPFSTEHAMTDGLSLPQQCDDGFGVAFGNDVWFRFTAVETGELTVDLCTATDYDARLAVYRDCSCPPAQIADCDDDGCGVVGRGSRVRISVTEGNCYTIRVGGFGEVSGSGILLLSLESSACPPGKVEFVQPPPEVVDARQPHPINATVPRQGIDSIVVQGPPGAPASCWQLCESADTGKANAIQSAVENPLGTYTLTLDRVITPVAATSIVYLGSGDRATYYSHPGNVNGDSAAAVLDVLAIIDCLNGVNMAISCPWGFPFSQDLDHSGGFGPADILREIDLLNGADALEPANGTVIPIAVDCP